MEAEVVLFSIQTAQQAKCAPMTIEPDSTNVADLSLKRKNNKSEITWIIVEIQASLKRQNLQTIQYITKCCNGISHSLTKIALEFENHSMARKFSSSNYHVIL